MSAHPAVVEAAVPNRILNQAAAETEQRTRRWLLLQSRYERRFHVRGGTL